MIQEDWVTVAGGKDVYLVSQFLCDVDGIIPLRYCFLFMMMTTVDAIRASRVNLLVRYTRLSTVKSWQKRSGSWFQEFLPHMSISIALTSILNAFAFL